MPDGPLPNPPLTVKTLIKEARDARVAARIQIVLSHFKAHVKQSSSWKVKQMYLGFFDDRAGPIRGLRLPVDAWHVLARENITTLAQLNAVADKVEWITGMETGTALAIRVELGRVAVLKTLSH